MTREPSTREFVNDDRVEDARACADFVTRNMEFLTERVVALNLEKDPGIEERFGPRVKSRMVRDTEFHLRHLAEAVTNGKPELFTHYLAWLKVLLAGYAVGIEDTMRTMECLRDVLLTELPVEHHRLLASTMAPGLKSLAAFPMDAPSFLALDQPHSGLANLYLSALLRGERKEAENHVMTMVRAGADIDEIYLHVFQRTQREVGRLWQLNHISVAQEHFCTAVTQSLMARLYPYLMASGEAPVRRLKCLAACVSGDLHAIGLNMVADFLERHGWECFYTGADTPNQAIIERLVRERTDVLLISVTITFHLSAVRDLIRDVRSHPSLGGVRIVLGGNAVNQVPDMWKDLGADASAPDAPAAVAVLDAFERGLQP